MAACWSSASNTAIFFCVACALHRHIHAIYSASLICRWYIQLCRKSFLQILYSCRWTCVMFIIMLFSRESYCICTLILLPLKVTRLVVCVTCIELRHGGYVRSPRRDMQRKKFILCARETYAISCARDKKIFLHVPSRAS